jgi:hypothetical protein
MCEEVMKDLCETGVNWDHDSGEIVISTRRRGIASKLRKIGLKPDTEEDPHGYETFRTTEDVLTVGFRHKKKRILSQDHIDRLQEGRRARRAQ